MRKAILTIAALIAIAILGSLILFSTARDVEEEEQKSLSGPKAPSFIFENYDGEAISSTSFLGKPHILNSWAVWCPFCVQELKDFVVLQEEFADMLTIVAINRAESLSKVKTYTDDLNATNSMIFLLDTKDEFYKAIGGFSMPETLFVNAQGEILLHKRGVMRLKEMQDIVHDLFGL